MNKYTWLLFDADDTLFDFPKAEANALRWTLEQIGLGFSPEYAEIYHACNQQVWKELERGEVTAIELRVKRFQLFFEQLGFNANPETISPLYQQNLALGADLLPGAEELIHAVQKDYHLALVTNGLKEVQRPRLERSPLRGCFEKIFISEEVGAAKPSPAYFDAVFEQIGQPPRASVLLIGDSLTSDMRGGLDYGLNTCWYNPTGKTASLPVTYQIANLSGLLAILQ